MPKHKRTKGSRTTYYKGGIHGHYGFFGRKPFSGNARTKRYGKKGSTLGHIAGKLRA